MDFKRKLSKAYLSNLQVNLYVADYIECDEMWKMESYLPEYNKLYFICEGSGWVETDGKSFFPKPNELVFIPAGKSHAFSYVNKDYYKKYWCHFIATIGEKNIFDIIDVPNIIKVEENRDYMCDLFKQLVMYYHEESLDAILKAKATLLHILAFFIEKTNAKELNVYESRSVERLQQLLTYIDRHLDKQITVEQLAGIVHLQVNYFIKFFKTHLGTTPMSYVKHQRMEKAKRLLLDTKMAISQVANQVGYKDISHFSKQFKVYTSMTPSSFRRYQKYDEEIKTKVNIIQKEANYMQD